MEVSWETSKENVQPIRTGRNVAYLQAALQPTESDIKVLQEERQKFEEEILAGENSSDPIDPWHRYLKWTEQHYPHGKNSRSYESMLEKYIQKFHTSEQYKNDPRYVNAWIDMVLNYHSESAHNSFHYMKSEGIGTKCAVFYIAWAENYEKYGNFQKADQLFQLALKNGAEPREVLQATHNAFQLRAARAVAKNMEKGGDANDESSTNSDRQEERRALGTLVGTGNKKTVGTMRTGKALADSNLSIRRQAHVGAPQKNSRVQIYQEEDDAEHPTGSEKWASAPDSRRADKENAIHAPKPWKGEKVRQKPRTTALSSAQPAKPAVSTFNIYHEDSSENSACGDSLHPPPSARKVAVNVERILTERQDNPYKESEWHKRIRESYGDKDANVIRMYPVEKVYSGIGEFQFEEIWAARWRMKKREEKEREEEKQKLQREEEERLEREREMQERIREAQEQSETMSSKLREKDEKLQRREEQLNKLMKMFNARQMEGSDDIDDKSPPRVEMTVRLENVCAKLRQIHQQQSFQESVTGTEFGSNKQIPESCSMQEGTHMEVDADPVDDVFDSVPCSSKDADVKVVPLPPIAQSESQLSLRNASRGSAGNSLNHSKLAQPSPTLFTKEAMGEIANMFQKPLNTRRDFSLYSAMEDEDDNEKLFASLARSPTNKFEIFRDDDENEARDAPKKAFEIFCEEEEEEQSENAENVPTPDYVIAPKRTNLAGVLQPAIGFELADPNEQEEDEDNDENDALHGLEPLPEDDDQSPPFLNDFSIAAGQDIAPRYDLISTPHCRNAANLPGTAMDSLSHIQSAGLQQNGHAIFDDSIGANFANGNRISAESTTYWMGGELQEASENCENENCASSVPDQDGKKKLSPILEASNESDKSLQQTRSRLISVESDAQAMSVAMTTSTAPKSFLHPPTVPRKPLGGIGAVKYEPLKLENMNATGVSLTGAAAEVTGPPGANRSKFGEIFADDMSAMDFELTGVGAKELQCPGESSLHQMKLDDPNDVDDLCDNLMSTSIVMSEPHDLSQDFALDAPPDVTLPPAPQLATYSLNIINDPWDLKLLNNIMSKCGSTGVIYENVKTPVARKGSHLTIDGQIYLLNDIVGRGGFAKVYKASHADDPSKTRAVKIQTPAFAWEAHILSETKRRLSEGGSSCFNQMLLDIQTAVAFPEGSFIVTEFLSKGTLLDMVKDYAFRGTQLNGFTIALDIMKLVQALHGIDVIHGDVKPDNFMVVGVRSERAEYIPILKLIDFGRAIDMRSLPPSTAFMKNCGTSGFECCQMKEKLPWNYHIDLYGIAGTVHVVLYNSYMETTKNAEGKWQCTKRPPRSERARWSTFFSSLLNFETPSDTWCPSYADSPLQSLVELFSSRIY